MSELNQIALKETQKHFNFKPNYIKKSLELLFIEEATVPFVARYRKEATGGLSDLELQKITESYLASVEKEKRREYILETLKTNEKLTPSLEQQIKKAETLNQLEDIYAPYKSKQKTKADKAREKGLEPLAKSLLHSPSTEDVSLDSIVAPYTKDLSKKEALSGAYDIIIETIYHDTNTKQALRELYESGAILTSKKSTNAKDIPQEELEKFKDYFDFQINLKDLKDPKNSYKYLALKRGSSKKALKIDIAVEKEEATHLIRKTYFDDFNSLKFKEPIEDCIDKAYSVYLRPALVLEIKSELKKIADESAIEVFKKNLETLLLQPYLGGVPVLGIDPGIRTGCKLAAIDESGQFLSDDVIYPHPSQNKKQESQLKIESLLKKHNIKHIAIGSGTYGRETLAFIKETISSVQKGDVTATLINEDGASIYSASEIARKEFPNLDVTVRGAISIARRFQDPLAEFVKIDPKSLGVGQYQHDVSQLKLKKSLQTVVEFCVNFVGVNLNTASAELLSYVSGLGGTLAQRMIDYRSKNQGFNTREDLKNVTRLSEKVFEQAAGFLRVPSSQNPLDETTIHPENYEDLNTWCKDNKTDVNSLINDKKVISQLKGDPTFKEKVGEFKFKDIIQSLEAPKQDPRDVYKPFEYDEGLSTIDDLKIGKSYPGIVTNITQFGAFVDIGIKENGLIHISQMSDTFVKDPLEVLKIGQTVQAKLIDLDKERKRVSLSIKSDKTKKPQKNKQKQKSQGFGNHAFKELQKLK